jgi:hypothetical protein
MHGMYQLEFYEQIKLHYGIPESSALTSGFMTGVPAGQHNGLLGIKNNVTRLTQAMDRFSQSKAWDEAKLKKLQIFNNIDYIELAEFRFRAAFNRFEGETFQKAVMFDVWTRQRNFISYYPRTLEWLTPVISPHMNAEYANFFMSLNYEHLFDRNSVELMFSRHYSEIARIASNSNGLMAIDNRSETALLFASKVLQKLNMPNPLPKIYQCKPFDFDTKAIQISQLEAFFPLLDNQEKLSSFIDSFGGGNFFMDCYKRALDGNTKAYAQIITIQSIALNLLLD